MYIAKIPILMGIIIAVACTAFAQDIGEIKEQKIKFSSTAFRANVKQPYAGVSGDGRTLSLDFKADPKINYPTLYRSKEGFFRSNTDYRLSFTYQIRSADAGVKFSVRVRDMENPSNDLFVSNLEQKDEPGVFTMRFRTPANAKSFAVLFASTGGSISAEVSDMKIDYGEFDAYVPATPNAQRFDVDQIEAPMPVGAAEFEVELPRLSGTTISAEHLGVEPGFAFMASKINQALKACKERGISKLVFPKGVYYIDEEELIKFEGLKDFELDGGGSTFVFKKRKSGSFAIWGCERVKVGNFNVDWDWETDPLGSWVKVTNARSSEREAFVDFTFVDYKEYPVEYPRISCLSAADEATRSVGVENGKSYMWETWSTSVAKEKKWITPNTLRVFLTKKEVAEFNKGDFFRMTHYYYDMHCFTMSDNKHLTLENVNVYSAAGHAFTINGKQQYWRFKNVNIKIPEGETKRAITCTADHLHIARSQGFFKMEDCEFSFGNDDCMNAHDNSAYVKRRGANGVLLAKKWEAGYYKKGDKIEFRNTDMSPTGFVGEVVSSAEIPTAPGNFKITFTENIPDEPDEFVIFNRAYDTSNIIIRNCVFRQNRARGLLILARNVTVENCKFFRNEMGAIKLESGWTYTSWSEGYGVDNVVVRNCEFDTVNPAGVANDGKIRDIFMGAYAKTDPSNVSVHFPVIQNVLFENNKFNDSFGAIAFISSASNVTFKDNTFTNKTARKNEAHYRGAFYVTHSSNVNIVNNTYIDNPLLQKTGVIFDKESCANIIAKGNTITKTAVEKKPAPSPQSTEREYNILPIPTLFPAQ